MEPNVPNLTVEMKLKICECFMKVNFISVQNKKRSVFIFNFWCLLNPFVVRFISRTTAYKHTYILCNKKLVFLLALLEIASCFNTKLYQWGANLPRALDACYKSIRIMQPKDPRAALCYIYLAYVHQRYGKYHTGTHQ